MAAIYEQIPIRLVLDIISNPPVTPVDANTGQAVQFWRAQDVDVQGAVFDNGESTDLSNLVSIQLIIQKEATSPVPLLVKTVGVMQIIPYITVAGWNAGTAQQFTFSLTAAETDFNLDGQDSSSFWLIIRGLTASGRILNYGGGTIRVFNPGNTLPIPMPGVVSSHSQTNSSGNSTVTPESLLHKEYITVNGVAGTRNILVQSSGLVPGSVIETVFEFEDPSVADIIINVYWGSLTGPLLSTFQTDGFQPNANFRCEVDSDYQLIPLLLTIPAFPV